jgi:hypothetical protein
LKYKRLGKTEIKIRQIKVYAYCKHKFTNQIILIRDKQDRQSIQGKNRYICIRRQDFILMAVTRKQKKIFQSL